MPNDGVHGVVQDSGRISLLDIGPIGSTVVKTFGLVRVEDTSPITEARDWTLYEACDWIQQGPDGDWAANRTFFITTNWERLTIGRGRVAYQPDIPPWTNDYRFNGQLNIQNATPWCRARARSFRAATVNFAMSVNRAQSGVGTDLVIRDNYRAWICEGRPVTHFVGATALILEQASVVTLGVYTINVTDIVDTTPIPDFCDLVLVNATPAVPVTVSWLNQLGQPLVDFSMATVISAPTWLAIPGAATRMILTKAAAPNLEMGITFRCVW